MCIFILSQGNHKIVKSKNMKNVDLRRHPYRGILKEIANELGRDSGNVHTALFKSKVPDPFLAELFDRKLQERQKIVKSFKKTLRKAV